MRELGSLMYAMLGTRPDLAFAVSLLSRFSVDPSAHHWVAMVHLFRYLAGTREVGITYGGDEGLVAFADCDLASIDEQHRRSVSGCVMKLAGGAVSWLSRREPSVALATGDAEYMALSHTARELVWALQLLSELDFPSASPPILYGDNNSAIAGAKNPINHSRSKHIDLRYHHLGELVERGRIVVRYMPTGSMVADGLTKSLGPVKHHVAMIGLGLVNTSHNALLASLSEVMAGAVGSGLGFAWKGLSTGC